MGRAEPSRLQQFAQPVLLSIGLAILILISIGSIFLVNRSQTDAAAVVRTLEVQNTLSLLRLLTRRTESGQRGYLLTGDPAFLDVYSRSIDEVMPTFRTLKNTTSYNVTQQRALNAIEPILAQELAIFRETIRLHDLGEREAALAMVRKPQNQAMMESIIDGFDRMDAEEKRLLALRSSHSRENHRELLIVNLLGGVAIIALGVILIYTVRRSISQRDAAHRSLETAHADLEAIVAERTAHLRKSIEEARRSGMLLNSTVESMADGILVADENAKIILSNPASARLLGSPATIQESFQQNQLVQPDGVSQFPNESAPLWRAIHGEAVDNSEFIVRSGAKETHVIANSRPIRDAEGTLRGGVAVYHDITQIRETERVLRQSQKMDAIGQLTGGLAHDFNNVLTVVIGMTGILAEAVADEPELAAVAHMADEAAERGAELIRNLLAFARKQPLQPKSVDINDLVINAGKLLYQIPERLTRGRFSNQR